MNINIRHNSLFSITGGQEVDHSFVKQTTKFNADTEHSIENSKLY